MRVNQAVYEASDAEPKKSRAEKLGDTSTCSAQAAASTRWTLCSLHFLGDKERYIRDQIDEFKRGVL
jgi:hypothetical protein